MRQVNFARWNHILIPATKEGRDRLRGGIGGKLAFPLFVTYGALTDEGRMVLMLALVVSGLGLDVGNTEIYLLAGMLWAAIVGSLAVRPLYSTVDLLHAEVDVARRVTLGEELELGVVLENRGTRDVQAVRLTGPFLPWDGRWSGDTAGISRLRPGERARLVLRARFVARGEHHLDSFHAEALVPFGLARGRGPLTTGARFLVLPRMARVARLTLPDGHRTEPAGISLASRTGESMELLGVRPYRPGDPLRHLHARSWARTGVPIVREFQEEFFRRVAVVVNIDPRDERSTEAAISLAAGVVGYLSRGEGLIDLLVVGERVHDLTLGRSLGFLEQALELLACFQPDSKATPSATKLLAQLEPHLARLSCVVVIDSGENESSITGHVRAFGVGCVRLHVTPRPSNAVAADGARVVDAGAIARDEELVL